MKKITVVGSGYVGTAVACLLSTNLLNKVDLPTFGRPTMATILLIKISIN